MDTKLPLEREQHLQMAPQCWTVDNECLELGLGGLFLFFYPLFFHLIPLKLLEFSTYYSQYYVKSQISAIFEQQRMFNSDFTLRSEESSELDTDRHKCLSSVVTVLALLSAIMKELEVTVCSMPVVWCAHAQSMNIIIPSSKPIIPKIFLVFRLPIILKNFSGIFHPGLPWIL